MEKKRKVLCECPYCGEPLYNLPHDEVLMTDNMFNSNDFLFSITCPACDKSFGVEARQVRIFVPVKISCMNGGEHEWAFMRAIPSDDSCMKCVHCGRRRSLTDEEYEKYLLKPKANNHG